MGKYIEDFNTRLILTDPNYYRHAYQSFMTSPEWFSVELSENLATFLKDNHSMFRFPYFRQIAALWMVFFNACHATRKESGLRSVLLSDYMTMDLFVVAFTTCELLPKGLASLILLPFLSRENPTEMQGHLADYYENFTREIETTAFFNHDYVTNIAALKTKWEQCSKRSWVDYFTWSCVLSELRSKGWVSSQIRGSFDADEGRPDILVKYNCLGATDEQSAVEQFRQQLSSLPKPHQLTLVNDEVYAKEAKTKNGQTYTSVYARISAPRYMTFKRAVLELGERGIFVRKIAGQDHVMIKCEVNEATKKSLATRKKELNSLSKEGAIHSLYNYSDGIKPGRSFCLFKVHAKNLDHSIRQLERVENTSIKFIHNF
jgi:hypothetical protein